MKKYFILLATIISLASCEREKKIEVFSSEKPFSLEIKKERSYYQAVKVKERLSEMGLDAYIINNVDSIEGEWFCIMSGALSHIDSTQSLITRLEGKFRLSNLNVVDYNQLDSFYIVASIDTTRIKEEQRIAAAEPNVPSEILQVVKSFPLSNALYLQSIKVVNFPSDDEAKRKSIEIIKNKKHDLPRGVSFDRLASDGISFSEAVFQDNLYGDQVTLQSIRLKQKTQILNASFLAVPSNSSSELAEIYADLILSTGNYLSEEKTKIEVNAAMPLNGYKVVIETKKDVFRKYYVLVDDSETFLFFSQSTNKTDEEMINILSNIGRSRGLIEYDEFYNTFYILPSKQIEEEIFLGFDIDKLTMDYAYQRGYSKWSVEMVGHWVASAYFYNTSSGIWEFSIFDMVSSTRQDYVYGRLYSNALSSNKDRIDVYGVSGYLIYNEGINWYTYRSYKELIELNFAKGRYICAIGNSMATFNKFDLVVRANSLQFVMGGYLAENKSEPN